MDIGSIFLILALLAVVVLLISRPLFSSNGLPVFELTDRQDHEYSALLAERDRVLLALEELDFDYTMGKIPEEDYPSQRAQLLTAGAEILRQLDEFPIPGKKSAEESAEARFEASLVERRAVRPAPAAVGTAVNGGKGADDDLEVLIASRRRAREGKSAGFCPQCGRPLQKADRFCPKCGATVK
jgi:hypothetical protein